MPLIVKPNARRMQAFRDSPSERGYERQSRIKVRLFLVIGVIVIASVLIAAFLCRPQAN